MKKTYLIFVACGSAAATCALVGSRLSDLLKKEGIDAQIKAMRVSEVTNNVKNKRPDLVIISAGNFSRQELPEDLQVLSGIPLMTMVGVNDFISKIKSILKTQE